MTEETKGLSFDDALKASIEHHTDEAIKEATDEPVAKSVETEPAQEEVIEAPSEFNSEEKEAWNKGDRKAIRSAWDRVNASRLNEINRLRSEPKPTNLRTSEDEANARLVRALKENTVSSIHEILKVKGLKPEEVFGERAAKDVDAEAKLMALQEKINALESNQVQSSQRQLAEVYSNVFDSIVSEKNEAGESKFPDLNNDERGLKLAASIGSLTRSAEFQQTVRSAIPNAGLRELSIAAYKALGGKVSEGSPARSQNAQNTTHIVQARKASASIPSRAPAIQRSNGTIKKYQNPVDALKAAIEYHNTED